MADDYRELPNGTKIDGALWLRVRARLLDAADRTVPDLTNGLLADLTDAACVGFCEHAHTPRLLRCAEAAEELLRLRDAGEVLRGHRAIEAWERLRRAVRGGDDNTLHGGQLSRRHVLPGGVMGHRACDGAE